MITLKARYDGRVFIPEGPVNLPAGCELEIAITLLAHNTLAELGQALQQLPSDPDWPADGAAQHDHYLYGTPKRENP